jgi:hypothetical protein
MIFGELLKSLAGKAGIKDDNEALKKLLAFSDAMQFDVPDEFSKPLEENLLTVNSAINNQNVRGPLFAEFGGSIDRLIDNWPTDFEFDDTEKGAIKTIEKDTKGKLKKLSELLIKKQNELKEKASKPTSADSVQLKSEITALKNQINDLNSQANQIKASYETQIQNLQEKNLANQKTYAFRTLLAGKPLPKNNLPQNVNIITAEQLIQQEMSKNGLQFHLDEFGNLILKQRKDGSDLDYFVNNKKIEASDFIDGVLAQNKFIQINDKPPAPGGGTPPIATPASGTPVNMSIVAESDQKIASLGLEI